MVFSALLLGLIPSFLVVGLGGLVRRRLSENAWTGLDRLNFEILFPALLFTAAASRPIDPARILVIGPSVWAILTLGLVLGYGARRFGPERFLDFAGGWQNAWRFNSAVAFVAVGALTHADMAMMAIVAGVAVPVANVFAVSALSRGNALSFGATLQRIALNPFLLASLGGVLVGLSGVTPPALLIAPLVLLAQAAIPIALISLGATLDWRALTRLTPFSGIICGVKLIALPAVTFVTCWVLNADPAVFSILTMFAALPTASSAHILASAFGADRTLSATVIAQSTLLSAVTVPIWITLVELTL